MYEDAITEGYALGEKVAGTECESLARHLDASLASFCPRNHYDYAVGDLFPEMNRLTLNLMDFANLTR